MAAIYYERVLDVAPKEAWAFVDAYSRSEVHVFSSVHNERQEGEYRVVTAIDNRPRETLDIRERIISTDADSMRHSYTVEGLFGATHHNAVMQIRDEGGKARLIWATDVLPHEFADTQKPYFDELFEELVDAINASGDRVVGSNGLSF